MTWLTWRLHRTEAVIGTVFFAALLAIMTWGMRSVDSAYDRALAGDCFQSGENRLCSDWLADYFNRSSNWDQLTTLLHGVPLAVAALVAIPTLHELERGTHRLAWVQSISRRRWTLGRIGFAAGVAALVAAIWAVRSAGWRDDVLRSDPRSFGQNAFELSPAVLIGYGLYALALALAVAVVVRRLVPTLAVLTVGFIGTRIFTTFVLRERYRSPVEQTAANADAGSLGLGDDKGRWVVDESWLNRTGERIPWDRVYQTCLPTGDGPVSETLYQQCLADNGFRYFVAYHPSDRFPQFQAIETALYLGLAAGLLVFSYWWLTRRPA